MTTFDPIRIHPAPGLPAAVITAAKGPALLHVGPDEADVWVVRGDLPPPQLPEVRPALVALGNRTEADVGWLEETVDVWAGVAEFEAGAADVARRAWSARLALRPEAADRHEDWLEAVRGLTGADVVARITGGEVRSAGATGGLAPLWACRALLARGARSMVAVPSASSLKERFGLSGTPASAVLAFPLGPKGVEGVLVLVVTHDGETWIRGATPLARAVVDAADRASLGRRLTNAETEHRRLRETMGRLVAIISHDLRSPLFAVQLGVKVLERQSGPSQSVAVLNRAVTSASDMLRRLVEAGRAVLEPAPARLSGAADLSATWVKVAAPIAAQHPAVSVVGQLGPGPDGAPLRVAVDPATLETLLRTLLSNAVIHGNAEAPVAVETELTDTEVVVRIRNRGRLPFVDLAQIDAFEHRSNGGLGIGLFTARRLARAAGVSLSVSHADGEVEARLGMKLVR